MTLRFPANWSQDLSFSKNFSLVVRHGGKTWVMTREDSEGHHNSTLPFSWNGEPVQGGHTRVTRLDSGEVTLLPLNHAASLDQWVLAPVRRVQEMPGGTIQLEGGQLARDPAFLHCLLTAMQFGGTTAPTHIQGETGVGKEGVARLIHQSSQRGKGPLVFVNCGALPPSLAHGELFGRERGSYTGATHDAPGLIEQAHGGTLFLDEVGELSLEDQARLLRVLETGTLRRLGAGRPRQIDVRIVSATHKNLAEKVSTGEFREDLYYRLCVLDIQVPPLRERPQDIEMLTTHFLKQFGHEGGMKSATFSLLLEHPWPGNIRELKNVLYRGVISSGGEPLRPQHLRLTPPPSREGEGLQGTLDDKIREELFRQRGNRQKTCDALRISRSTLYRWVKRHPNLVFGLPSEGSSLEETLTHKVKGSTFSPSGQKSKEMRVTF
jgi:DNA-binding NtrC family response regulator